MTPRSAAPWIAAFLAGCASRAVVEVELPREEGMASLLVGIEHDGAARMFAYDLASFDPDDLPVLVPYEGSATLLALYYAKTLDALRIPRGELSRALDPERSIPLPDFDAAYRVDAGDVAAEWEAISTSGEAVPFRLPKVERTEHCFELGFELVPIVPPERFFGAVATSDREVLAFGLEGSVLRVTPEGSERVVASTAVAGVRAAALAPNGEVFLGDRQGRIHRGHPERGFEVIHTVREPVQSMSSGGDADAGTFDLFVMTSSNSTHRYDGGTWKGTQGEVERDAEPWFGEIVRVAYDHAVWLPMQPRGLGTLKGGIVTIEPSEFGLLSLFGAITQVRDGRVAVINSFGALLEEREGMLVSNGMYEAADGASEMTDFGPGFLYVRRGASIIYGQLDEAQCPPVPVGIESYAGSLVRMGDRVVGFLTDTRNPDEPLVSAHILVIRDASR